MKKTTLFKNFLLAVLLLGGAGSAEATTSTKVLYRQNYSAGVIGDYWTSTNGSIQQDDTHGRYVRIQSGGDKSPRYGYTTFSDATLDWTGVNSYTIEFDLSIESKKITSSTGELALMDSKTNIGFKEGKDYSNSFLVSGVKEDDVDKSAGNVSKNLFYMAVKDASTSNYTIKNNNTDITIVSGNWYHYKFDVNVSTGRVDYTITGGSMPITGYYTVTDESTMYCTGIFLYSGRKDGNGSNIDNILITTEVEGDVANVPSLSLTGVAGENGTSRVFTITGAEGETVKYKIGDEGAEQTYSSAVTVAKDEKLIAWTTKGEATSSTVSHTVVGDEVVLATPTVSLLSVREGATKYYSYSATKDAITVTEGSYTLTITPNVFYATSSDAVSGASVNKNKSFFTVETEGTYYLISTANGGVNSKVSASFANTGRYLKTGSFSFSDVDVTGLSEETYSNKTGYQINGVTGGVIRGALTFTATSNTYIKYDGQYLIQRNAGTSKVVIANLMDNQYAVLVNSEEGGDKMILGSESAIDEINLAQSQKYTSVDFYTPEDYSLNISTVDDLGFTFCHSNLSLDFTAKNVEAYTAAYNSSSKKVELRRVYKVPANTKGTGLFIKGSADNIPVMSVDADNDILTNNLKAVNITAGYVVPATETINEVEYTNYVLALADKNDESKGIVFLKADGTTKVAAGKAYLQIPTDDAPATARLMVMFDDETTGIGASLVNSEEREVNSAVYDLQGRRVAQPTKGLYIVDGKKVIVK